MGKATAEEIKHLMGRAGFGLAAPELARAEKMTRKELVDELFVHSQGKRPIKVVEAPDYTREEYLALTGKQKKKLRRAGNAAIVDVRAEWIKRLPGRRALREKMALFWHGHFACRPKNGFHSQLQYNLFHSWGLESFRKLLHGISRDPAMLVFLNNQQNRKRHPNENFAREVMELFTLGRGHYTENDIKEAARAFTGWHADLHGKFAVREKQHDDGEKTFRGKTGKWDGEDIINFLLDDRQTANFITEKIFRYLVGEPDKAIVRSLSKDFYESDYDISGLLRSIFLSDFFYEDRFRANKIKSPLEYMGGLMKVARISFRDVNAADLCQRFLGQELFRPPNVAGWPGGKSWIDSTTLIMRLKLPEYMFRHLEFPYVDEEEADMMDRFVQYRKLRKVRGDADWKMLEKDFRKVKDEDLAEAVMKVFLPAPVDLKLITGRVVGNSRADILQSYITNALSVIEYQLC